MNLPAGGSGCCGSDPSVCKGRLPTNWPLSCYAKGARFLQKHNAAPCVKQLLTLLHKVVAYLQVQHWGIEHEAMEAVVNYMRHAPKEAFADVIPYELTQPGTWLRRLQSFLMMQLLL